jgi:hypothetical protein
MQADGITTDEGAALQIFDLATPRRFEARTPSVKGTMPWKVRRASLVVPHGRALARVTVTRRPLGKSTIGSKGRCGWTKCVSTRAAGSAGSERLTLVRQ